MDPWSDGSNCAIMRPCVSDQNPRRPQVATATINFLYYRSSLFRWDLLFVSELLSSWIEVVYSGFADAATEVQREE